MNAALNHSLEVAIQLRIRARPRRPFDIEDADVSHSRNPKMSGPARGGGTLCRAADCSQTSHVSLGGKQRVRLETRK